MTAPNPIHEDLHFIRQAVARRERNPASPAPILYLWAVYVLIGYTLLDFNTRAAGWFFLFGGLGGGVLSGMLGRRAAMQAGEHDRELGRRMALHWSAIILAFISLAALSMVLPQLRGQAFGQVFVVMIGLIYFTAGIHLDRHFLWLGPVLIAGGVVVGLVPHYGWTGLGVVIALGLVVPSFFGRRQAAMGTAHEST